jgi:hypothetical protein
MAAGWGVRAAGERHRAEAQRRGGKAGRGREETDLGLGRVGDGFPTGEVHHREHREHRECGGEKPSDQDLQFLGWNQKALGRIRCCRACSDPNPLSSPLCSLCSLWLRSRSVPFQQSWRVLGINR